MKLFTTEKHENFKMKFLRFFLNSYYLAYRRCGGKGYFVSNDWHEVHVKVKHNWLTKNYVGTTFGGCLFGALDPIYMLQLIKILGNNYVVWDKAASIDFIRPVRKALYARFLLDTSVIEDIKEKVKQSGEYIINLSVSLQDDACVTYVTMIKTMYIADKAFYRNKRLEKQKLQSSENIK